MATTTKRRIVRIDPDAVRCPPGPENQPVSMVQWVPVESLSANDYNPNHVAPPEMRLLAESILEDGWTQPIVVRETGELVTVRNVPWPRREVVDGFHRSLVARYPEVAAQTAGLVPIVVLRADVSPAHQRMSTIRHNRARGNHHVLKMADIVAALMDRYGLSEAEIIKRLGMEDEEVQRLHARGNMIERGRSADGGFNRGWVPGEDE